MTEQLRQRREVLLAQWPAIKRSPAKQQREYIESIRAIYAELFGEQLKSRLCFTCGGQQGIITTLNKIRAAN